ncbi:hypothetical protein Ocin01_09458 [Orchesella cincta]|uniref:Uncharacterized protein n=1 Tax=Orchesella cincta TaxID=48709 RepID=A0A1D2MVW8_ORCCI|nr:hypothetical protein Ocin01_09458 [Orchesella cincta]
MRVTFLPTPQFRCRVLLFFSLISINSDIVKSLSEMQPCHDSTKGDGKHTNITLTNIDDALDSLYKAIKTNASFEEECNDSVEINSTEISLVRLMEKFEIRRSFYSQGLWGNCAEDGAQKLIEDINTLKNIATGDNGTSAGMSITLCDRDQLLECHPTFKKCQCITDDRDFRNIVSEYWDNEEEISAKDAKGKSLGRDGCVLVTGSNCPVANESPFLCIPGSNCLTKKGLKPCVLHNLRDSISSRSKRSVSSRYSFFKDTYPTIHCQCP